MVNLLPQSSLSTLRTRYWVRTACVLALMLSAVCLLGAILMFPAYIIVDTARSDTRRAADAEEALIAARGDAASADTLAQFAEEVRLLRAQIRTPRVEAALAAVLAYAKNGIAVTAIESAYDQDGNVLLTVKGIAATRARLASFAEEVRGDSAVISATVPVSQLVKERDAEFGLSVVYRGLTQ